MTFAEKLRELRDAAGLSEAKLAKASGLNPATLHDYAMGRRTVPGFTTVVKLARALGVSCEAFAVCSDLSGQGKDSPAPDRGEKKPVPGKPRRRGSGASGS
ncbi:MAG: helix-turn-helix transcriptional regulator [Gemmataceae bacterium]|nr:helix-turn-helix transcriptional regulator [Gemmataceae bacterium]